MSHVRSVAASPADDDADDGVVADDVWTLQAGGSVHRALTLSNVAGIFYILISGLCVSLVIAVLEFSYRTHRKAATHRVTHTSILSF